MTKKEIQKEMIELEGKEIFIDHYGKKKIGRISGCDYYVGFTIQNANIPGEYIVCYNGPYSPKKSGDYETHYDEMVLFINAVREPIFNIDEYKNKLITIRDGVGIGSNPSADFCPFT